MTDLNPEGLERAAEAVTQAVRRCGHDMARCSTHRTYAARSAVTAYLGHAEVTTVEELDALPNHSVVLDDLGDAWQKIADHWESVGEDIMSGDAFFRFHNLKARPARIIYRPIP